MHVRPIPWLAAAVSAGLVATTIGCRDNPPQPPETEQTSGDEDEDREAAEPGGDAPRNPAEGTGAEDAIDETRDELDPAL